MAKITHYDIGKVWKPQSAFTVGGAPTDPTTITVKYKNPAGTITTLGPVSGATGGSGITRVSAGVFNVSIALDTQGYWFSRFEGTGTAAAAEDHEAIVDPSEFFSSSGLDTRALVSVAETKDWLQHQDIETTDDLELVRVINDVSDRMHYEAGREFKVSGTNPQTRSFPIETLGTTSARYIDGVYFGETGPHARKLFVGDLTSFTQVQIIDSTDWTTVLETVSPLTKITAHPTVRQSWEPIRRLEFLYTVTSLAVGMRVAITGNWGFPAVPGNIRQATLNAIAAIMDRDVEHYRQDFGAESSVAGETGNVILMTGGSQRLLSLPPASLAVAWSYRDSWLA